MAQPVGTKRKPYNHHQPPRQCSYEGCTNVYTPENSNQRYCKCIHYATCAVCGSKFVIKNMSVIPESCSKTCGYKLRQMNRSDGYGGSWKQKCIATNLKNRGVMFPMQSETVRRKSSETSMKHFGVSHPMKSTQVVKKLSDTVKSRYGVDWAVHLPQCIGGYSAVSKSAKRVIDLFEASGLLCEVEYPIGKFRYDIRIKDTNVLIEVDPTVTHNSYCSPFGEPKSQDYHRRKTQVAVENGYVCFHIWDWTSAIDLLHGLLYSKQFCITDTGQPSVHYYNNVTGCYQNMGDRSEMISNGYFPIHDDGYHIEFIY